MSLVNVTTGPQRESVPTMPRLISEGLLRALEAELERAVARVERQEVADATLSLAFKVGWDKEGAVQVQVTQKGGSTRKGTFSPGSKEQAALPFVDRLEDPDTETLPGLEA